MRIHHPRNRRLIASLVAIGSGSARSAAAGGLGDLGLPGAIADSPLARWLDVSSPTELAVLFSALTLGTCIVAMGAVWLAGRRRNLATASISIAFPGAVRGEFKVSLFRETTRRAGASRSAVSAPVPLQSKSKKSSTARLGPAHEIRLGVQRETQFDGLRQGRWLIRIEGQLRAPNAGIVLSEIQEEIAFDIDGDRDVDGLESIVATLPAPKVPAEIRVHWDRQPARDIGACLATRPESLRYASQGVARMNLNLGESRIVIGSGDRVVERTLDIESFEPVVLSIDLATSDGLIFKGCPPAVTSYLQGDLGAAARSLERDGQRDVAKRLLALLHQEQGQTAQAANALEEAGQLREAAELLRSIGNDSRAAALFEEAGALEEAAQEWATAGKPGEAARIYMVLEAWSEAASCFEKASDQDGLLRALEAQGEFLRAAGLASERDERGLAIRLLQQVGPQDADYGQASELLVFAFEQEGHVDLAAAELERRLGRLSPNEALPDLEIHLSELCEELGDYPRALGVLESLRDREPAYPEIAARIEGLRKKLSASAGTSRGSDFTPPPGATAFVAQARYQILEEIGRGGMGRVYRARDERLGREVALKRMPENLQENATAVSLFLGEARAAARMNHPHIVTLFDADQEDGQFFITMELMHGLPLNVLLGRHGPFAPRDLAQLGLQACAGLAYAHDEGIIHRDIKTANFFVTRERTLKIMDFGLAKILEAVRDKGATLIAGTPFYMAPEQSTGAPTDPRADLYALGVTFFELATGELPFPEGDVAMHHRMTPPPEVVDLVPSFPRELSTLITQLMEKDPADRPSNATEVASALSDYIDSLTLS